MLTAQHKGLLPLELPWQTKEFSRDQRYLLLGPTRYGFKAMIEPKVVTRTF